MAEFTGICSRIPCAKCGSAEHYAYDCPDVTIEELATEFGMRPVMRARYDMPVFRKYELALLVWYVCIIVMLLGAAWHG